MAVRADWHEDVPAAAGGAVDPFRLGLSPAMTPGASPFSMDMSLDALRERLVKLFKREKFLFEKMNLSCPLKERCDTSCLACPFNEADDPDSLKGQLCKVGMDQERAETMFAAKQSRGV